MEWESKHEYLTQKLRRFSSIDWSFSVCYSDEYIHPLKVKPLLGGRKEVRQGSSACWILWLRSILWQCKLTFQIDGCMFNWNQFSLQECLNKTLNVFCRASNCSVGGKCGNRFVDYKPCASAVFETTDRGKGLQAVHDTKSVSSTSCVSMTTLRVSWTIWKLCVSIHF